MRLTYAQRQTLKDDSQEQSGDKFWCPKCAGGFTVPEGAGCPVCDWPNELTPEEAAEARARVEKEWAKDARSND